MVGRFLIVSIRTAMGVFEEKFSQSYFYSFPAGLLKEVRSNLQAQAAHGKVRTHVATRWA